jgi:hypothetical protein
MAANHGTWKNEALNKPKGTKNGMDSVNTTIHRRTIDELLMVQSIHSTKTLSALGKVTRRIAHPLSYQPHLYQLNGPTPLYIYCHSLILVPTNTPLECL